MTDNSDEKSAPGTAKLPVKTIVVAVVVIAFMVIFKRELGGLLERTSDFKISAEGVVIKAVVKTVETPIGTTEVSVVPLAKSPQSSTGVHGTTYVNTEYAFQISWPNAKDWTPDEALGAQLHKKLGLPATVDIPIVILSNTPIDRFRPNINVVVEKVGDMSIQDYMAATKDSLVAQGWEVLSTSVDPKTRGGVIVFINNTGGERIYQFQRIAMNKGNAYVITASQVPKADLSQGLKQGLGDIVNSFRVIQ